MFELKQLGAFSLMLLVVVLLLSAAPKSSADPQTASARYLALISIDACRPDYLHLTEIPNISSLMTNGVTYTRAWTGQLESNTPPGHATTATGSLPRNQGVIGFGWRDLSRGNMTWPTTIEAVKQGRLGEIIAASGAVSIQQLIKENDPSAKTVTVSSNKFFAAAVMGNKYADHIIYSVRSGKTLVPSGVEGQMPPSQILNDPTLRYSLPVTPVQYDAWAMDIAVKMLELERPRALMINLPETDGVGHQTGGIVAPQTMAGIVANVDRQIGRLIQTYRNLGIYDQTLFIVTADHGMIPNTRQVRSEQIRKAVEQTGTRALSLGGGTSFDIYLRDQTKSREVAESIASQNIAGVDAVYYRLQSQGTYQYVLSSPYVSRMSQGLDAAYRYLLSTFAGPTSPDVAAVLNENTVIGEDAPNTRGSHGGLSWDVEHIPLIISGPGVKKGYVSQMPAGLIDIAPTTLSLMGIAIRRMDGLVLADALIDSSPEQLRSQTDVAERLKPFQDALMTKSIQDLVQISGPNHVTIEADYSKEIGKIRSLQGVNAGPLPLRANEAPLYEQYTQIGVDYVRTHDVWGAFDINVVFPNMQADPSKESSYNFKTTDREIEAIRSTGAQVYYRLGYRWWGPNDVLSDYDKFAEICKHIVMHYNQEWANGFRYGIKYWEVWNEPDLKMTWKGTPEQYFRLYDVVARALKTVDTNLKVGGPAFAGGSAGPQLAGDPAFLEKFLQFCNVNKPPLDFASWHCYPHGRGPYVIVETANEVQRLMRKYGYANIKNILSEWNIYADYPNNHDEFENARGAAWTLSTLIFLQDTPVSKALRYRGNGGEKGGVGFGLFYTDGEFRKPAYSFLAMKRILETPVRLACNGSDNVGFATLAGKSENGDFVRVLISSFDSSYNQFTLILRNLPWQNRLTKCEVHLIDETHDLTLVDRTEYTQSGSITIFRRMAPSSVYLISLTVVGEAKQTTTATIQPATATTKYESPFISIIAGVSIILIAIALIVVYSRKHRTQATTTR